jgi:hypothetical protein
MLEPELGGLLAKLGLYVVLPVAVLGGTGLYAHHKGFLSGEAEIQAQWNADREAGRIAIGKVRKQYDELEAQNRLDNQKNAEALIQKDKDHEIALATARTDFVHRLQLSTDRAALYQRAAKAGTAQCGDLASYAGELDHSLEEGRGLVRELRETLGQRDDQLGALSQQLLNDRKLFTGTIHDTTNGQ